MDTPAKPKTTPKDFFLWLGAMVALYVSAISFILLAHQYIEIWFPNELISYGDPYSDPIRFAIASLLVMFPLFVWMLRLIHQDIRQNPEKKELWVRRWLVFLTLFIAGLVMAIDVIMLVNSYLQGDLSVRFALKAVVVFLVFGGTFAYFINELRGTWERNPALSVAIGGATSLLVVAAVVASFFIIGSPESARLTKFDDQKIADLQNIQWQIVSFWQTKEALPSTLDELKDPIGGFVPPLDTQTGASYRYERTSDGSFKLCAIFNLPSRDALQGGETPARTAVVKDSLTENFQHGVGEVCFDRTIDPERYPPYRKTN